MKSLSDRLLELFMDLYIYYIKNNFMLVAIYCEKVDPN